MYTWSNLYGRTTFRKVYVLGLKQLSLLISISIPRCMLNKHAAYYMDCKLRHYLESYSRDTGIVEVLTGKRNWLYSCCF